MDNSEKKLKKDSREFIVYLHQDIMMKKKKDIMMSWNFNLEGLGFQCILVAGVGSSWSSGKLIFKALRLHEPLPRQA